MATSSHPSCFLRVSEGSFGSNLRSESSQNMGFGGGCGVIIWPRRVCQQPRHLVNAGSLRQALGLSPFCQAFPFLSGSAKSSGQYFFRREIDDSVLKVDLGCAEHLRISRHIGDFTRWRNKGVYAAGLDKLLHDLKRTHARRKRASED
jgi:hypothetical protein